MMIVLPNKEELEASRAFKSYNFENGETQLSVTFNELSMEDVVEKFTLVPTHSITIKRTGFPDVTYDNIKVTNISENIGDVVSGVVATFTINK